MYTTGTVLNTDADLYNAMLFTLNVAVYQGGESLDDWGVITKLTEQTVMIDGGYFFRETCEFRVR
jgi:hypothetical protein